MAPLLATLPHPLAEELQSARDLARRRADRETLSSTAVSGLDRLLAGGLARGELVELIGRRTSGRFSLVLATLAAATHAGESVALVDLGDHLDPQAAGTFGADLERLLWLRPRHLKEALIGAEVLIGGGFPLVVLDLGTPPVHGGRGAEASWLRLARATRAHKTALLIASPYRVSGTAATAVLEIHTARSSWRGRGRMLRLLENLYTQLVVEKCRGHRPGQKEMVKFHLETGVPRISVPTHPGGGELRPYISIVPRDSTA